MSLGCSINIVVLFLLQAVTNEVIETSSRVGTHVLHHLGIQTALETRDLLGVSIHHVGGIATQIVEGM
jgi:hypothetical protein